MMTIVAMPVWMAMIVWTAMPVIVMMPVAWTHAHHNLRTAWSRSRQ